MSLDTRARHIRCDSEECSERLAVPLRSPSADSAENGSRAAGWTFVAGAYEDRHYCPACSRQLQSSRR